MSNATNIPSLSPWHVGGPFNLVIYRKDGWAICDCKTFHGRIKTEEAQSNARLISAAPSQEVILKLLALGLARFETSTNEFCFAGIRYSHHFNWAELLDVIGWDVVNAAITKAKGGEA